MRVKIKTIKVSHELREAIAAALGKSGECSRAEARDYYERAGDAKLREVWSALLARRERS
jgi:hypothetical protein